MAKNFAWGIDIGNRALKAVKLVRENGGVRIDDFDVIEHEHILSNAGDNRESLIQGALAMFSQRHNPKGAPVAIGVSGQQSFARFIKLPPVEPRKIPEIVRFEAIQQIPFPLDEVEWAYQLFQDESSPDVEVGIFAMRKDLVNQHIAYFSDAGMNVQVVQMNPLAVYNALYHDRRLEGTSMIIDLGAENADLIITEGEQIWMRSIPIGGNNFTEALVKSFKLRFEKAEELKRNAATSKYGRQILQAMRPIFADLVAEIQRSIGFYSSVHRDSRIQRVIALGGTFRLPGLQKYLQQNLSLEVQKLDRLGDTPPTDAKVATTLNENILSSVSAYGLALQAMGDSQITSSLLPQIIQRERMWRQKTPIFAAAAAIIVAGVGIPLAVHYTNQLKYNTDQAKAARLETERTTKLATTLANDWRGTIQEAGAPDRKLIADVKSLANYRDLWPAIYDEIRAAIPPPPLTSAATTRPTGGAIKTNFQNDRRILLDDIHAEYHPDIAQFANRSNMPDAVFNGFAAKRVLGGAVPMRGDRPAAPGAGVMPVMPTFPPAGAPPGNGGAAGGDSGGGQRGYLITIHTVTPNPEAPALISENVVKKLMDRQDQAAKAGRAFRILRVTIPSSTTFSDDPDRVQFFKERAKTALDRKAAEQTGNVDFTPPSSTPGAVSTPLAPQPFNKPPPGAPNGQQALDEINIFLDPQTNEDVRNWSDVTVLLAVQVVDPRQQQQQSESGGGGPEQPK